MKRKLERKTVRYWMSHKVECDGVWHYIIPADGGKHMLDGKCDCA